MNLRKDHYRVVFGFSHVHRPSPGPAGETLGLPQVGLLPGVPPKVGVSSLAEAPRAPVSTPAGTVVPSVSPVRPSSSVSAVCSQACRVPKNVKQLLTVDPSARASMKNAASCDT